jgi:predicted DNA-binding transcriptional regulator AlpA
MTYQTPQYQQAKTLLDSPETLTLDAPEAALLLGISKPHCYQVIAETGSLAGLPIIKIGNRKGDNAPMAIIELVEPMLEQVVAEATGATKRAAKESAAAAPVQSEAVEVAEEIKPDTEEVLVEESTEPVNELGEEEAAASDEDTTKE